MDQKAEERRGDPDMGSTSVTDQAPTATVILTLGGTDAGPPPDHNPALGTPHSAAPIVPPTVIHSLGDARPGEANPAATLTTATGEPLAGQTAEFLAAREDSEETRNINRREAQSTHTSDADLSPYGDSGSGENVAVSRPAQQDQQMARLGANDMNRGLEAPHSYASTGSSGNTFDATNARVEARTEANAKIIQRAESLSGLDSGRVDYERAEFAVPVMNEVRDEVATTGTHMIGIGQAPGRAATVTATFPDAARANRAVQGLRGIGIAAADITVIARDPAGAASAMPDTATGPISAVVSAQVGAMPAGGGSVRRSDTALPNDEDLPSTVDTMTDEIPAGADPSARPAVTDSDRGGLARDEGLITRIDAPADPQIYSDFVDSDADHRTTPGEGAAQTGGAVATAGAASSAALATPAGSSEVFVSVHTDRLTHGAVRRVLADNGATAVH